MHTINNTRSQFSWGYRVGFVIFFLLAIFGNKAVFAAGAQTFGMDLSNAGPYNPASLVVVRYHYACSSLTTGCGNLSITTPVPSTLQYMSAATPAGTQAAFDGTNLIIARTPFADGESGDVSVTFLIKNNTAGATINLPAESVITDPTDEANRRVNTSVNILVGNVQPSPQYFVTKTKQSPVGTPVTDTDVTYQIQVRARKLDGNTDVQNVTVTDTFPAGATVVSAYGSLLPDNYTNGTVSGNTITWTIAGTDLLKAWTTTGNGQTTSDFPVGEFVVTLRYPSGTFGSTDVTNQACMVGSSAYGNVNECGVSTHGFSTAAPTMAFIKQFPAYEGLLLAENNSGYFWRLAFNTYDSNVPLQNTVFTETVPTGLQFSKVYSGEWLLPTTVRARVEYSTDNGNAWTVLGTQDGANPKEFVAGTDYPATGVTHFRWVFLDDLPIGMRSSYANCITCDSQRGPGFYFTVPAGSAGSTYHNCATATYNGVSNGGQTSCHDLTIPASIPRVGVSKYHNTANIKPGDEVEFSLGAGNTSGSAPYADPVFTDLLPPELEFVRWSGFVSSDPAAPSPNFVSIPNYNGTGRTLLKWTYGNTVPTGAVRFDGSAGVANPYSFPINQGMYGGVDLKVVAKVKAGTAAGSYINRLEISSNTYSGAFTCAQRNGAVSESVVDTNDVDGDGNNTETLCESYGDSFTVLAAAVMGAEKWIKGNAALPNKDDPNSDPVVPDSFCPTLAGGYTRFPCIARTVPGGVFEYKVKLINYGNQALKDYVAYDVFPFVGDTGVSQILSSQTRDTQWSPLLTSAPTAADAYTASVLALPGAELAYTFVPNPCRPELSNSSNETGWQTGCVNDWTTTVTDWSKVKGFRLKVPFTAAPHWEAGKEIVLNVPMQVPVNAPFEAVAWNSIAHRATNAGNDPSVTTTRLDTAEPRKVGIAIPAGSDVPGYRLGNLVWLDTNKNGQADTGEAGISGVLVNLYKVTGTGETLVASTNTDSDGKYLFSALEAGDYRVQIPADQSTALTPTALTNKTSSNTGEEADPNADGDNNDNGTVVTASGIQSAIVTLGEGTGLTEPTTETLRKGDATDDDNDAFADNRSNLSVDFGFVESVPTVTKTDLKLVKTVDKTTARKGDTLTYTLTLSNESDVDATNVTVTDNLPTGVTLVKATPSTGTFNAGAWSLPSVKAHTSATLTLEVTVN